MNTIPCSFEISCRPTPWDTNSFGINTFEISLQNINDLDVDAATTALIDITKANAPTLFYSRTNANFINNKLALLKAGFFNCETQLHIVNNNIKNYSTPIELGKRRLRISAGNNQDYIDVAEKSSQVFKYSRFHEDPFIKTDLSNLRMQFWCNDMHRQQLPLLVYRNNMNELDSFIFYKNVDENSIELVLGGSMPGKGMMTPLFWASFIEYFKSLGINRIETKISASNITIANIYIFFNFKIKATYFDFHKHVFL